MEAFATLLGSEPKFNTPARTCPVVTDEIKGIIRKCLEDNRERRATGMRKLQWTCRSIHTMLLERGFTLSYPSVCNHVRRISATMGARPQKEVYVRREHDPGQECEFDWGEIPLVICDRRQTVQMAVFTLLHSNRRSAWLFRRQDTLSLMEAHRNFFAEIQGVPQTMVYDNMKVAVIIRTGRQGRPAVRYPTKAMQRLSLYYKFEERFCNARSGWEKGSVEIVRHAAFVSRQSFETLDAAQNWLDRIFLKINTTSGITGISDSQKQERIHADLYSLQPAPQPMGCFEAEEHTPDNYGTINVDYNNYSVPEGLVGSSVLARVYSGHIAIYHQGRRVADHVRLEGKGGWSMQLEHYLGTFLRKPGALDNSTAMRQVPAELAELYRVHFCPDRQREFIRFMMYARDNGIMQSRITAAARSLRLNGVRHMTADHLKVELDSMLETDMSENDADTIASVSCLDIHPRQQRASIEEHAETTLDSLTAVLCRHPKLHAGNIRN
ncbi:transposase [Muribaculum caecicola]|uniref:Transposase n=1 Tax=Muribaculum caecicola TaxID=3038144 RepID=A0AC61S505_9BACT|nr:transposase [Muribaculum caecicola]